MFRYRQAKPTMAAGGRSFLPPTLMRFLALRSFVPARDARNVSIATSPHAVKRSATSIGFSSRDRLFEPTTVERPRLLGLVIAGNAFPEN